MGIVRARRGSFPEVDDLDFFIWRAGEPSVSDLVNLGAGVRHQDWRMCCDDEPPADRYPIDDRGNERQLTRCDDYGCGRAAQAMSRRVGTEDFGADALADRVK